MNYEFEPSIRPALFQIVFVRGKLVRLALERDVAVGFLAVSKEFDKPL